MYSILSVVNNIVLCFWDFPGSPVAKTLHSQYWGREFRPWSGNSHVPQIRPGIDKYI